MFKDDLQISKNDNTLEYLSKIDLIKCYYLLQSPENNYRQLENQVFSSITGERIAISTMLDRLYQYYQDKPSALASIRRFAKQYQSTDAVRWFTKDTFIYRFVNQILRSGDIELFHNIRFYIAHLSTQLVELKYKQNQLMNGMKTVYRGLRQSIRELEALQNLVGCVIVTKSFTSTSWDKKVALFFAGIDQPQSVESQPLLLELRTDFSSPSIIAADVSHLSSFPEECEVLFDIATEFYVQMFAYDSLNCIWICQLLAPTKSSTDIFTEMKRTLPWAVSNPTDLIRIWQEMGIRSWQQGDLHRLKFYIDRVALFYEQNSVDQYEIARFFAFRSLYHYKIGECVQAIDLAERAIAISLQLATSDHLILARYYRILGLAYSAVNRIQDALDCYSQALIHDENVRVTSKWSTVITLREIASVYRNQGDITRATEYFIKTWAIFREVSHELFFRQ